MADFNMEVYDTYTSLQLGHDKVIIVDDKEKATQLDHGNKDVIVDKQKREVLHGTIQQATIDTLIAKLQSAKEQHTLAGSYGEDIYYVLAFLQDNYYEYMSGLYQEMDDYEKKIRGLDDKINYRQQLIQQHKEKEHKEVSIVTSLPEFKKTSIKLKHLYESKNQLLVDIQDTIKRIMFAEDVKHFLSDYQLYTDNIPYALQKKWKRYQKKAEKYAIPSLEASNLDDFLTRKKVQLAYQESILVGYEEHIDNEEIIYEGLKHRFLFAEPVDIEITDDIFSHDQHIIALQEQKQLLSDDIEEIIQVLETDIIPFKTLERLHKKKSRLHKLRDTYIQKGTKLLDKDPLLSQKQHERTGNTLDRHLQHIYQQINTINKDIQQVYAWYSDTPGAMLYNDKKTSMKEKRAYIKRKENTYKTHLYEKKKTFQKKKKRIKALHEKNRALIAGFEQIYTQDDLHISPPLDIASLEQEIANYEAIKKPLIQAYTLLQERLQKESVFFIEKQGLDMTKQEELEDYVTTIPSILQSSETLINILYTYKKFLPENKINEMKKNQFKMKELGNTYYEKLQTYDTKRKQWLEDRVVYDEQDETQRSESLSAKEKDTYRVTYDMKNKNDASRLDIIHIGEGLFASWDKVLDQHISVHAFIQYIHNQEQVIEQQLHILGYQHETPHVLLQDIARLYLRFINEVKQWLERSDYGKYLSLQGEAEYAYQTLQKEVLTIPGQKNVPRLPHIPIDDMAVVAARTKNKRVVPAISLLGTSIQQMRSYIQAWQIQQKMVENMLKHTKQDMKHYKKFM